MTLFPYPGKPGFYGVGLPGRVISCQPCTGAAYSRTGLTTEVKVAALTSMEQCLKFLRRNLRERWAFKPLPAVSETCLDHERLSVTGTPKYLLPSTTSKACPCSMHVDWYLCLLSVLTLMRVHLAQG